MIEGSLIELRMIKVLKKGMLLDKNVYTCKITSYDSQDEKFTIRIQDEYLTLMQLDAKYEAKIFMENRTFSCEGRIKERYQSEDGSVVIFLIENGFYKVM